MGLLDRDYYVEHTLRKMGILNGPASKWRGRAARRRLAHRWMTPRAWVLLAVLVLLLLWVWDMRRRGIPISPHGFRFWLSLYLPQLARMLPPM